MCKPIFSLEKTSSNPSLLKKLASTKGSEFSLQYEGPCLCYTFVKSRHQLYNREQDTQPSDAVRLDQVMSQII